MSAVEMGPIRTLVPLMESSGYRVRGILGRGAFGLVFQCMRSDTKEMVAIKAVPNTAAEFGDREVDTLKQLRQLDQDKSNLMRFNRHIELHGNIFLEFEKLDMTLVHLMDHLSRPLQLSEIQIITEQVLVALNALKSIRMVHTDIKLDNIMLIDHQLQPFKVKLIDFGLTLSVSDLCIGDVMQVLEYRAPEVILGLPLNEAIDIWSLGCIMVTMYLDSDLGSGDCELGRLEEIVQFHGQPNENMLNSGIYTKDFFNKDKDSTSFSWKLKTECSCSLGNSSARAITGEQCTVHQSFRGELSTLFTSLDDIVLTRSGTTEYEDTQAFLSLIHQMLEVDPQTRITPIKALGHSFITMKHFPSDFISNQEIWPANLTVIAQICTNDGTDKSAADSDNIPPRQACVDEVITNSSVKTKNDLLERICRFFSLPFQKRTSSNSLSDSTNYQKNSASTNERPPPTAILEESITTSTDEGTTGFTVKTKSRVFKTICRLFSQPFKKEQSGIGYMGDSLDHQKTAASTNVEAVITYANYGIIASADQIVADSDNRPPRKGGWLEDDTITETSHASCSHVFDGDKAGTDKENTDSKIKIKNRFFKRIYRLFSKPFKRGQPSNTFGDTS